MSTGGGVNGGRTDSGTGSKNDYTNGANNTEKASSRTGAFSGYVAFLFLMLHMFVDDAFLSISIFMFSTSTGSFNYTHAMFIILFF